MADTSQAGAVEKVASWVVRKRFFFIQTLGYWTNCEGSRHRSSMGDFGFSGQNSSAQHFRNDSQLCQLRNHRFAVCDRIQQGHRKIPGLNTKRVMWSQGWKDNLTAGSLRQSVLEKNWLCSDRLSQSFPADVRREGSVPLFDLAGCSTNFLISSSDLISEASIRLISHWSLSTQGGKSFGVPSWSFSLQHLGAK